MKRLFAALVLGGLLSACQTLQTPVAPQQSPQAQAQWKARQQQLTGIRHFALRGRIASSGLGGGSGDLSWDQVDDHFVVLLSGTFGVGAVRIEGTPADLAIVTRDGEYRADEAEAALREKLGAPLPIADLRYWILGLPRPDAAAVVQLDESGRLSHLEQEGWHLDYIEYRDAGSARPALPHKLWLSCGSSRWKLVIDLWNQVS